jgi:hypothetical protein
VLYQRCVDVTGFAVTARAIRGYGHLSRENYSVVGSISAASGFVKFSKSQLEE